MPAASSSRKEFFYADMMSESLRLYIDNYRLFLLLSLAGTILFILKTVLDGTGDPVCQMIGFVLAPLGFGFGILFYMSLIYAVAKRRLNETTSFMTVVQEVFPKFWRATGATVVFIIVLILGALLLVVPAIYWLTAGYFFMYFIVLDDRSLWDSFGASVRLVKGHFWEVLGAHVLMVVIALAFLMPFYMGMWLIGTPVIWRETIFQVLGVLLMPFSVGLYYQLYVWLKKKEPLAGQIRVVDK
jgi:hypothetical protein